LFLGTIIIKYEDYCEREYNLSPLPGFSNSDVTNSSDSSVINNNPLLLLVFSDLGVINSSDFSIISSSPLLLLVFSDLSVINSTEFRFISNS
jgi:hypothetical protein